MIEPTEADIGRRVIYDPRPVLPRSYGVLVGVSGGWASNCPQVRFDFMPPNTSLNVGPGDLHWVDSAEVGSAYPNSERTK